MVMSGDEGVQPTGRSGDSSPVSGPCLPSDRPAAPGGVAAPDERGNDDNDDGDFAGLFQLSSKSTTNIKARMKDKSGRSLEPAKRPRVVMGRKVPRGGSPGAVLGRPAGSGRSAVPARPAEPKASASISLVCRMFRVGTLKIQELCLAVFSMDGLRLEDMKAEAVSVPAVELTSFEMSFGRTCSMLFVQTTAVAAMRLCCELHMSRDNHECFDPMSDDPREMYIILVLDSYPEYQAQRELELLMEAVGRRNNIQDFCQQIKPPEANQRLMLSSSGSSSASESGGPAAPDGADGAPGEDATAASPVDGNNKVSVVTRPYQLRITLRPYVSDDSGSAAGARFLPPVEKLVVFPPPPAKGAISVTNEDLLCLNPGESLNDVIIDFYLSYLVMEKLESAVSERVHVFSSFFYKRLNQRDKSHSEEAAGLTLPQRRHRRVRTWTRHVDIFTKDFIFVPINETSHWFLAVICFPGLHGKCYVPKANSLAFAGSSSSNGSSGAAEAVDGSKMAEEEEEEVEDGETGSQASSDDADRPSRPTASTEHSPAADSSEEVGESEGDSPPAVPNGSGATTPRAGRMQRDGATVCKQPCILIMDSLKGSCRNMVAKTLREYLEVEWLARRGEARAFTKDSMKYCSPKVPQQDNFSDCGVYLLQYVESFFENPVTSFELPLQLSNWFPQERVKRKREELQQLILLLHHKLRQAPRSATAAAPAATGSSVSPSPDAGDPRGTAQRDEWGSGGGLAGRGDAARGPDAGDSCPAAKRLKTRRASEADEPEEPMVMSGDEDDTEVAWTTNDTEQEEEQEEDCEVDLTTEAERASGSRLAA